EICSNFVRLIRHVPNELKRPVAVSGNRRKLTSKYLVQYLLDSGGKPNRQMASRQRRDPPGNRPNPAIHQRVVWPGLNLVVRVHFLAPCRIGVGEDLKNNLTWFGNGLGAVAVDAPRLWVRHARKRCKRNLNGAAGRTSSHRGVCVAIGQECTERLALAPDQHDSVELAVIVRGRTSKWTAKTILV